MGDEQIGLDLPLQQVIGRLRCMERSDRAKEAHLLDGVVADSDRANLPLTVELMHRLSRFLDGHRGVRPVYLIDIDVIGLQAPQGILKLPRDAVFRRVAIDRPILPLQPRLCRDDDRVSFTVFRNRLSNNLLSYSHAINGRRVHQIDPAFKRGKDRLDAAPLVRSAPHPSAHGPCAQSNARDREINTVSCNIFHFCSLHSWLAFFA